MLSQNRCTLSDLCTILAQTDLSDAVYIKRHFLFQQKMILLTLRQHLDLEVFFAQGAPNMHLLGAVGVLSGQY